MTTKNSLPKTDPQALLNGLETSAPSATDSVQFTCRLVTPLFGGGVEAGEVDQSQPVRPTAIRGQLRYWWRIANRGRFRKPDGTVDSAALFRAERELWGGLGASDDLAKSKIVVRVASIQGFRQLAPAARYDRKSDGSLKTFPSWEDWAGGTDMGYALFSAQGKAGKQGISESPRALVKPGTGNHFKLILTLAPQTAGSGAEEQKKWLDSATQAVHWWAHFGGLGARTRRGLGAILVENSKGAVLAMPGEEEQKEAGVELVTGRSASDAVQALRGIVGAYRDFRQGPGLGRNPGSSSNRPGRSRWPEPDALRRIKNKHNNNHAPEHPAGNWFPRALFGLPIVFHFKGPGEPGDCTLIPSGGSSKRMASPFILRPISADGKNWYEACLIVEPDVLKKLGTLELEDANGRDLRAWPADSQQQKQLAENVRPLKELDSVHPFQALAKHISKRASANQGPSLAEQSQAAAEAAKPQTVVARAGYNRGSGALIFEPADKKEKWTVDAVPKEQADRLMAALDAKAVAKLTSNNKYAAKWELTIQGKSVIAIKEAAK